MGTATENKRVKLFGTQCVRNAYHRPHKHRNENELKTHTHNRKIQIHTMPFIQLDAFRVVFFFFSFFYLLPLSCSCSLIIIISKSFEFFVDFFFPGPCHTCTSFGVFVPLFIAYMYSFVFQQQHFQLLNCEFFLLLFAIIEFLNKRKRRKKTNSA